MVYTHVKSFTIVKNRKSGQVTSHCRKARPYGADLSLFLNVPVVTVKSELWNGNPCFPAKWPLTAVRENLVKVNCLFHVRGNFLTWY